MLLLTNKELKSHKDAKVCYICRKYFMKNSSEIQNIEKLELITTTQVNIEAQQVVFVI